VAAEPILRVDGVVREYGDRVRTRALDGVDLELHRGELTALIGPSGSGKSTLLNVIGLLDRPTAGRVVLEGVETTRLDDRARTRLRGRTIGFVFQFHHLLPAFTAIENVMLSVWGGEGAVDDAARQRARELLEAVGLSHRMTSKASNLSGGEQQRVAIARALARDPLLVLSDEPTGNLDTASADDVFELMRTFNRERGTTFLVVTHDPRIAGRCRRVVEIVDGRIAGDRTLEPAPEP
jgi:lipoprotein-releasing system ATP-binding protein